MLLTLRQERPGTVSNTQQIFLPIRRQGGGNGYSNADRANIKFGKHDFLLFLFHPATTTLTSGGVV